MSKQSLPGLNGDGVLLYGYYKKLKTMKKKFFVLYDEAPCKVARIEYYDNEKKYKSGFTPKRIIKIKNCFNINRRLHTKHAFVIVLASKDGGFGIVMDTEDEMNTWLNHLLNLQRSGDTLCDYPKFDYVWQALIQKKGIAEQHNLFGTHHVCLTNKSVTFIKIGREKNAGEQNISKIDVLLTTIRRCGDSQCYFYMEIGRQSFLGPGELWMETEDNLTAQNMHKMILSKMVALNEALIEPMRKRSSSATDTINLQHDRKSSQNLDVTSNNLLCAQNFSRDRCDSLPSRNRTSSECSNRSIRAIPTTSANRANNLHGNYTSWIAFSASEESINVDDSEDCMGKPFLIRSHLFAQTSSLGGKYENDITSDVNRVRAFSVGARVKSNRITSKMTSKLYNNGSVDSSTRKSISVPVLINKNLQSADQLGDLMEIDFSKSIGTVLNNDVHHIRTQCQNASNMLPRNLAVSNSEEFIPVSTKGGNNGYLKMKPITLDSNSVTSTGYNRFNKTSERSQIQYSFEQKDEKINFLGDNEGINEKRVTSNLKDTNYLNNDKNVYAFDKDAEIKSILSTGSSHFSTCSKNNRDPIELSQPINLDINKDLYYATLDLPKSDNEVNNRYGFQENPGEIREITNEYAKIDFVKPNVSQSLTVKKY